MPAVAQEAPDAAAPTAPAPAPHHTVHHARRHHRHGHPAKPAPEAQTAAPVQPPAYTEAPTPNGNLLPPQESVPPNTSVLPGTMQLHYPPSGEGYVPGSSPQAMDDARTAKVPGVTLHVPLQQDPAQPLPPPTDPGR
jgi:hypothetical protein